MTATRKKRKMGSMRTWRKERGTYRPRHLEVPEDMELFTVDKAGPRYLNFYPYEVREEQLGAEPGDLFVHKSYWTHTVGPSFTKVCCPRRNFGKKCPICEESARLKEEGASNEDLASMRPKERQLWLVKDLKDTEKGVQLYDVSYFCFGQVLKDYLDNADESDRYDEFWYPERGHTVKVGFKIDNIGGRDFEKAVSLEFKPRKHNYSDEELDALPCLDDVVKEVSYEELKDMYFSFDSDDDDKEADDPFDEEEVPWDKEEEDEPEEEEVEEEPKPEPPKKRRGRPPKKKPEPEPEEEDEEEDEADEDWNEDEDWGE